MSSRAIDEGGRAGRFTGNLGVGIGQGEKAGQSSWSVREAGQVGQGRCGRAGQGRAGQGRASKQLSTRRIGLPEVLSPMLEVKSDSIGSLALHAIVVQLCSQRILI